jgi:hypothetical protein
LGRLTAMGIEPLGALEKVPSLVESRVWQPPIKTADPQAATADVLEEAISQANAKQVGAAPPAAATQASRLTE